MLPLPTPVPTPNPAPTLPVILVMRPLSGRPLLAGYAAALVQPRRLTVRGIGRVETAVLTDRRRRPLMFIWLTELVYRRGASRRCPPGCARRSGSAPRQYTGIECAVGGRLTVAWARAWSDGRLTVVRVLAVRAGRGRGSV